MPGSPLKRLRDPYASWKDPAGNVWACFYRENDKHIIDFPELAEFLCSASGVTCRRHPSTSVATCRHLFLNQVKPLLRSLDGTLVLHASSIDTSAGAILFAAETGRGKSTLATFFGTQGHLVLGDDCAVVKLSEFDDSLLVEPSHHSVRLWSDSSEALLNIDRCQVETVDFSSKLRFTDPDALTFGQENRPVSAVFFLGGLETDNVSIKKLSARAAFERLVEHQFVLDAEDQVALAKQFNQIIQLVETVPHYELTYRRDYNTLTQVRRNILKTIGIETEI